MQHKESTYVENIHLPQSREYNHCSWFVIEKGDTSDSSLTSSVYMAERAGLDSIDNSYYEIFHKLFFGNDFPLVPELFISNVFVILC